MCYDYNIPILTNKKYENLWGRWRRKRISKCCLCILGDFSDRFGNRLYLSELSKRKYAVFGNATKRCMGATDRFLKKYMRDDKIRLQQIAEYKIQGVYSYDIR